MSKWKNYAALVSSKNWIAVQESRQSESHYEKSKSCCLEMQVLIEVHKYLEDHYVIVYLDETWFVSYDTVRMLCTKGTMLWWYKRLFFIRTTAERKTSSNKSCWEVWKLFRKFPFTLWKITFNAIRGLPWWYEWNCIWGLAWEHF